jgi:hypothetical protein
MPPAEARLTLTHDQNHPTVDQVIVKVVSITLAMSCRLESGRLLSVNF